MHIIGDADGVVAMSHDGQMIHVPIVDWQYTNDECTALLYEESEPRRGFHLFLSEDPTVQRIFFLKSGQAPDAFRAAVEGRGLQYRLAADGSVPAITLVPPTDARPSEAPETVERPAPMDITNPEFIRAMHYAMGLLAPRGDA